MHFCPLGGGGVVGAGGVVTTGAGVTKFKNCAQLMKCLDCSVVRVLQKRQTLSKQPSPPFLHVGSVTTAMPTLASPGDAGEVHTPAAPTDAAESTVWLKSSAFDATSATHASQRRVLGVTRCLPMPMASALLLFNGALSISFASLRSCARVKKKQSADVEMIPMVLWRRRITHTRTRKQSRRRLAPKRPTPPAPVCACIHTVYMLPCRHSRMLETNEAHRCRCCLACAPFCSRRFDAPVALGSV